MKRWPIKPLEQIAKLFGGSTPSRSNPAYWNGKIHWVTPTDLPMPDEGISVVSDTKDKITDAGLENSGTNVVPKGTVLFSSRATIGKVAVADMELTTNQGFANFVPSSEITSQFLAYSLWYCRNDIARLSGSTTFKEVSRSTLRKYEIPVPPLAEQERIVKLLDEADALRKLRAQADRRTAEFIPALFHQVFGDPATNPKRWPQKRLGEATIINPKLPSDKRPSAETEVSFVPMATVNEILGTIPASETRQYSQVAKGYTPFQNGDVLFAKITPCMQNGKSAIAENLVGGLGFGSTEFHVLRPTEIVTAEYIFWLVRRTAFRAEAEQNFTGTGGQQRVPTSFMENYPCPIPPLPLQKEFAGRVKEIRALETAQARSRARLDALFASLLDKAFKGEL